MKIVSGYYTKGDEDFVNTQYDIAINSCGRFELVKLKEFKTCRPNGRKDYQLLYIASGKAFFIINGEKIVADEGSLVLYLPGERQDYGYYLIDQPVIYWLHFSGCEVLNLLRQNGLTNKNIFFLGISNVLPVIFDNIIRELQFTQTNYFEICNLLIKQIITLSGRFLTEAALPRYKQNQTIESAINYFNDHFNVEINVRDYAQLHNMSYCWFIRSFKRYTGITPAQYIINTRIQRAKSLLSTGSFTVSEVSNLVGYENPLYFSRIFKKNVGIAPKSYSY